MKTNLSINITNIKQAKIFLRELHKNNESYHPEDDANDIIWTTCKPTKKECKKLNILMEQIYQIKGFDPCEYLVYLINNNN